MSEKPRVNAGEYVGGVMSVGTDMVRWAFRAAKERLSKMDAQKFLREAQTAMADIPAGTHQGQGCLVDVEEKSDEYGVIGKNVRIETYSHRSTFDIHYFDDYRSGQVKSVDVYRETLDANGYVAAEEQFVINGSPLSPDTPLLSLSRDLRLAQTSINRAAEVN